MQEFFEFGIGTRVLYKPGLAHELGTVIEELGAQRPFIIADKGVVGAGLLDPILNGINAQYAAVGLFDAVPANSSVDVVMECAAIAKAAEADLIVAIGGGSPLDTAKAVRIILTFEGHLLDYQGYNVISDRLIPMIAVPTTSGTGSEVTPYAVIRDAEQDLKLSFASRYLLPDVAVLDPLLTCTLPPMLTAATGIDALSHAIETFVSTENTPFSDGMALEAIRLISTHLRTAVQQGEDMEARSQMLIAACMAGMACANSYFGVIHAMAHAVGGKFHVHHGTAISICMPHGMRYNSSVAPARYLRIAEALGVSREGRSDAEVIAAGIAAVAALAHDCGLPSRLRDVGVPTEALTDLAATAVIDGAIFHNPREASEEEVLALFQAAW
ncbi:iron-containing alcohol dehydrogenase [Oscillochloris trichoides DG-6]|uniref:Iron-containing alcohol dehydrogenase n=1 Tax=Oscillochloris trichoides DG-6 TaxID=765420 RepID=E1IIB1_9CHLR|nr:iron-containing alcohol dehydrogenase [Oscillochloris trichoides]EFO79061.1 iron-containing alcohol dehydrogenase [Oscillochloris trichoides DG-6]